MSAPSKTAASSAENPLPPAAGRAYFPPWTTRVVVSVCLTLIPLVQVFHKAVVRAMPSTPAMLGMGITGSTSAEGISIAKLFKVENLINATGRSVYIEDEKMLDAVTALSGSGPAYFYYVVKHMGSR